MCVCVVCVLVRGSESVPEMSIQTWYRSRVECFKFRLVFRLNVVTANPFELKDQCKITNIVKSPVIFDAIKVYQAHTVFGYMRCDLLLCMHTELFLACHFTIRKITSHPDRIICEVLKLALICLRFGINACTRLLYVCVCVFCEFALVEKCDGWRHKLQSREKTI